MVLLLGASGLLGHNVLRVLSERGVPVRVLLRPGTELLFPAPDVVRGSLLDPDTLLAAAAGCDAIINCAGTTDMRLPRTEDFLPVNRDLPALLRTHNTDQLLVGEWYDASRARRELAFPATPVADAIRDFFAWRASSPSSFSSSSSSASDTASSSRR